MFLSNFGEILSEFRGKPQRMIKAVEILLKIHEIIRKIAKIVGISEIIQFADWIIQSGPYLRVRDDRARTDRELTLSE